MWSFFLEQGQLFLPQNSEANCIHELFVAWTSDHFTSLEGCNKTKISIKLKTIELFERRK